MALKSGRVGVRNDQVDAYGRISVDASNLTKATTNAYGVVKVGTNLSASNGVLSTADDVTLDNIFANEEIEFTDNSGDFGTNAKAKINSAISSGSEDSGKVLTAQGSGAVAWQYPNASNINSGSATSGQVLTANGSGGASWTDTGAKLYLHTISGCTIDSSTKDLYIISTGSAALTNINATCNLIDKNITSSFCLHASVPSLASGNLIGAYASSENSKLYGLSNQGAIITIAFSALGTDTVTTL